jgi:hypothetical protein
VKRGYGLARQFVGRAAIPCGMLSAAGERYYRFPVLVECGSTAAVVTIIARRPMEAANAVLDEMGQLVHHPLTVTALGARRGTVKRYQGWEMALARQIFRFGSDWVQLELPLTPAPATV